jgi:arylsulfatase A-like enzyme
MLTGLYDSAHGVIRDGLRLGEDHATLTEVLRDAGYRTAGFFGGPYLHPSFGLAQGFETYLSCMTWRPENLSESEIRVKVGQGAPRSTADVTGPRTLSRVGEWIEQAGATPYFLFIHLWDVHFDYLPPQRYIDLFDPDYDGDLDPHDFFLNPEIHDGMDGRDLEHVVARYDAEIRFTDDIIAAILEELDQAGLFSNTMTVVTSDHGEEFFEHGGKGHRSTLFDELVKVPLIAHWPGHIRAGTVIDQQASLIDVMPTLLSLAGVPLPTEVQGRDLGPLLRGDRLESAPALLELAVTTQLVRALRTNREKLIDLGSGRLVYFDLEQDPDERRPSTDLAQMRDALSSLRRLEREAEAFRDRTSGPVPAEPDPAILRQLESLGYVGDSEK